MQVALSIESVCEIFWHLSSFTFPFPPHCRPSRLQGHKSAGEEKCSGGVLHPPRMGRIALSLLWFSIYVAGLNHTQAFPEGHGLFFPFSLSKSVVQNFLTSLTTPDGLDRI